jgi:site-specific DNA-methyltransferase (adenine-specific)
VKSTKLSQFKQDPNNANRGTDRGRSVVQDSLKRLGAGRSILVDKNGVAIAGNKTAEAALAIGLDDAIVVQTDGSKLVVVQRTDLDLATDATAKELAIVDNRASELGLDWDAQTLAQLSEEIDLSGLWTDDEWLMLLPEENDEQPQETEESPERELVQVADGKIPSRVQPGEIWEVAGQRLYCGDCREPASFDALLQGRQIHLAVTSPPYASQRDYDQESGFVGIAPEDYSNWYAAIAANIHRALAPDGNYFLNIKEHSKDFLRDLYVKDLLIAHVRQWGWLWLDEFIWTHGGIPGSPQKMGKFKNQWEPIFWFAKKPRPAFYPERVTHESDDVIADANYRQSASVNQGRQHLLGDRTIASGQAYPGNVLSLGRNSEICGHPAAYPIALPEFFIQAYSDSQDLVFDPFLGSGTTLLACYKHNRAGLGVELSPAYCEVILRRLEAATGVAAVQVS